MQETLFRSYNHNLEELSKVGPKPYLGWTTEVGNRVDQKIGKNDKSKQLLNQSDAGKQTRALTEDIKS